MATITPEQAEKVAKSERSAGRLQLAEFLGWESFDEKDDLQRSIWLDYLYDNLMFAVQKGFPWDQTGHIVKLAEDLLETTKGKSLTEAIKEYTNLCYKCKQAISEQNLKVYSDFVFASFFKHYNLFQVVFTCEQDRRILNFQLPVEIPTHPLAFSESKPINIWEYEEKIREIDRAEEVRKEQLVSEEKKYRLEQGEAARKCYKEVEHMEIPVEREALMSLINGLVQTHVSAASHQIQANIQNTQAGLDYMITKSSMPRPQELGPPMKFPMRTLQTPLNQKRLKSANPKERSKSRASSRSSKGRI